MSENAKLIRHQSKTLVWKWHFQDFVATNYDFLGQDEITIWFRPRFAWALDAILVLTGRKHFPVTTFSSVRLAFIASIAAAGIFLKKSKKDGEVIARDIAVKCDQPIVYTGKSRIPVTVKLLFHPAHDKYVPFESVFGIGDRREHHGHTNLLYCRPNLTNFSYLE